MSNNDLFNQIFSNFDNSGVNNVQSPQLNNTLTNASNQISSFIGGQVEGRANALKDASNQFSSFFGGQVEGGANALKDASNQFSSFFGGQVEGGANALKDASSQISSLFGGQGGGGSTEQRQIINYYIKDDMGNLTPGFAYADNSLVINIYDQGQGDAVPYALGVINFTMMNGKTVGQGIMRLKSTKQLLQVVVSGDIDKSNIQMSSTKDTGQQFMLLEANAGKNTKAIPNLLGRGKHGYTYLSGKRNDGEDSLGVSKSTTVEISTLNMRDAKFVV